MCLLYMGANVLYRCDYPISGLKFEKKKSKVKVQYVSYVLQHFLSNQIKHIELSKTHFNRNFFNISKISQQPNKTPKALELPFFACQEN